MTFFIFASMRPATPEEALAFFWFSLVLLSIFFTIFVAEKIHSYRNEKKNRDSDDVYIGTGIIISALLIFVCIFFIRHFNEQVKINEKQLSQNNNGK